MDGFVFVLLLGAELGISVFLFGRSVVEHLETYRSWNALLGLFAHTVFAAVPLMRRTDQAP
jgi:hypothetical protein